MAGFDILNVIGDPWNEAGSLFGGIKVTVTDTASRIDSKFLEMVLNGATRYTVWKTGETFISNDTGTSIGGFGMRGGAGEMALTSQIDQNSGWPADVIRYYWENSAVGSDPGSVAVIKGMGRNRLSIESLGSIVHISMSGRYEFETSNYAAAVQFVAYEAASAVGTPFIFNNHSQERYADSVVKIGVDIATQDALHIGKFDGRDFTTAARFDGTGVFYGRGSIATAAAGTIHGFAAQTQGDVAPRMFMGVDGSGFSFFGFGPGNAGFDSLLLRTGANTFALGGSTAAYPAIKRSGTAVQARLANDSGFTTLQGKLTTDQTAVTETVTPNRTLTLYDASGTAYKVPCVPA